MSKKSRSRSQANSPHEPELPPPDALAGRGGSILPTEQVFVQLGRFLEAHAFESIEDVNTALQTWMAQGQPLAMEPTTPQEHAQALIWQAAEALPPLRLQLTQQALALDPDCADAYTMQAELATTLESAHALYAAAVAAAERTLDPTIFTEDVGHFWGIVETRPYMRARAGLAQVLWARGDHAAAITHYHDLLRLNPNDNQGLRYDLARWLMITHNDAALKTLFQQYKDDGAADWLYTKALWLFRTKARAKAMRALKEALAMNGFVPAYLLGAKAMPKALPAFVGMGDANEAIMYAVAATEEWYATPGAIEWLVKGMALHLADTAAQLQQTYQPPWG